MLVYRDAGEEYDARRWAEALRARLPPAAPPGLEALLRAAALECALADAGQAGAQAAAALTDGLAEALLGAGQSSELHAAALLDELALPERLTLRRPEGYAFYALDVLEYARLARECARSSEPHACVIGIRSIGTSLSAVVRAELARVGVVTRRFTVRPAGHPWQRRLSWSAEERRCVDACARETSFFVVDEGPGMSGSTFLAVADALVELGVPSDRIRLFGSRALSESELAGTFARLGRFDYRSIPAVRVPAETRDLSGGAWRELVFANTQTWPACWTAQERVKYLSSDGLWLAKFTGYAPYDADVRRRADVLARAGLAPALQAGDPGFSLQPWVTGRSPRSDIDRTDAVPRLARYLAFRTRELPAAECSSAALEQMARVNVLEELGVELPRSFELCGPSPVEVDGRLMPHEWIAQANGEWLKADASDHADDHFFPGFTDAAWDVAGAIVEWDLDRAHADALVTAYRRLSGADPEPRLAAFRVAYAAFRVGVASFAAASGADAESQRWRAARLFYREKLAAGLTALGASP